MPKFALFRSRENLAHLGRSHAGTAAAITGSAIAAGLLEGAGIGLLIPFLSSFSSAPSAPAQGRLLGWLQNIAGAHSREQRLALVAVFILACIVLRCCIAAVQAVLTAWLYGRVGHQIRCALSERLHNAPYTFFLSQKESRLVNILTEESWRVTEAVRVVLTRLASTAVVLAFGALLFLVSWRLSLVVLLGALIPRLFQRKIKARLRAKSQHVVGTNEKLLTQMLFSIFGARLIRIFHTQRLERTRFAQTSDDLRKALFSTDRLSGLLGPTLEVSHGILFLAVLLVAVLNGLSIPVLVTFLVLMNRMQPHLRNLEDSRASLASLSVHFDEIEWLLAQRPPAPVIQGDTAFRGLRDDITFHNVTYAYPGVAEPVLREVSFTLRRGRAIALIGSSGAGKSTILNLLCRLLEPTSGSITADGQPLSQLKLEDWLDTIAVAGQDIELVDGTIADNIAYGRPDMTRAAIVAAADDAQAGFIHDLPHGLDTLVGARGLSLSGGQRQRLGLARALARKPDLLILDEATNAVDLETEDGILDTITRLPPHTTVLVVSHRPSTLAFCDDAVVLEKGRVVRSGPLAAVHPDTSPALHPDEVKPEAFLSDPVNSLWQHASSST